MKALIQRISSASVVVDGREVGSAGAGLLVLLGVGREDTENKVKQLADKVCNLRIFEDEEGKMNLSLMDVKGDMLVISQFTLYADLSAGRRPSFTNAAAPDVADDYYEKFIYYVSLLGVRTAKGLFGAHMDVSLTNSGPVTIIVEV